MIPDCSISSCASWKLKNVSVENGRLSCRNAILAFGSGLKLPVIS
jgi:hypothetical protein